MIAAAVVLEVGSALASQVLLQAQVPRRMACSAQPALVPAAVDSGYTHLLDL